MKIDNGLITDEDIAELHEALGNTEAAETIRFSAALKAGDIGIEATTPMWGGRIKP